MSRHVFSAVFFLALVLPAPFANAITINRNYIGPLSATEAAVIDQAASYWENLIVSSEVFNVDIDKSTLTPGRLGEASNYTSSGGCAPTCAGTPTGGTITFTDSVAFYVDSSPADDTEYQSIVSPTTYLMAVPAGQADGFYDLLTVAIHEFGHILGISSSFDNFAANISLSQTGAHYTYVFPSLPVLGDPSLDYLAGYFTYGGALMPLTEDDGEEAGSTGGLPSHLDEFYTGDQSAGLFSLDVMNANLQISERIHIANVDLDILADAYGYSVVPEPGTGMMLFAAVLAAAFWRRHRRVLRHH